MPFSTNYANNILNYVFSKTDTLVAPNRVYIGLCSNDPEEDEEDEIITELSGSGYTRVLISQKGETFPDVISSASNRGIANVKQINWAKATGDWERAKGFFLSSSPTVGETTSIFFYGKLDLTEEEEAAGGMVVNAGAVALFDPQTLAIRFPKRDSTAAISV